MDAFEARLQFTSRLSKLSASSQAAKSCAQFALKHKEFHEDLHSCILEQLGSVPMNTRVNLLYFIEVLCETGTKQGFDGYMDMIRKDLFNIIENVVPRDGSGVANVGTARRVMGNLLEKSVINQSTKNTIDKLLSERESEADINLTANSDTDKKRKFDEKTINQRMNEDRERHKRLRENIWAIPPPSAENMNPEFELFWENCSDLGEDDYEIMREENEILKASVVY
ncbi:CTD kinase subunit gamma CTK3-domain-containing protein [Kalaharituber pfeilii]|nr:CTD kinase subunit gamma CTK3-domain-containing protein [Kalaharituber pfeilii]